MLGPTKEHYLIVKEGDKEVYRKVFISFDGYLDADFYKNLGLELNKKDNTLKETEIDLQSFFVEYWRYIAQRDIFKDIAEGMQHNICLTSKEDIVNSLMSFKSTIAGKFFNILDDMKEFAAEDNRTVLDKKYKMYLEIKYDIEDIEGYKRFLREFQKWKEKLDVQNILADSNLS